MTYHNSIGQFDMSRGLRRPAPATYASTESASIAAPAVPTMSYVTQTRASASAPSVPARRSYKGRLGQSLMLQPPQPLTTARLMTRPTLAARAIAAPQANPQKQGTAGDLCRAKQLLEATLRTNSNVSLRNPATGQMQGGAQVLMLMQHPEISMVCQLDPRAPLPRDAAELYYAVDAWLRQLGMSVPASALVPVATTKGASIAPLQTTIVPGYQATGPVAPEEPLAPEVTEPRDASVPDAMIDDRGWTVPAPANLLPSEGSGGGGIPWWAWLIGGVAVVGGGVYYATRK